MNQTNQFLILNDGRKLGFAEFGNKNGFPVIYCHGSQSSRLEMHYDLSFTIESNIKIITIDRPGHGISDFNPKGTILSFSEDVKQLTTQLNINRFSIVGMSAGAPFALGIAYYLPSNVHKTVIISGFAPYIKTNRKHLSKEVSVMLGLAKTFPSLLKILLKFQNKQMAKNPKKALQGFLKIMSEPDKKVLEKEAVISVIENMFKEAFRQGSKGIAYEISKLLVNDWNFDLAKIQTPVLFFQGLKDNNVPYQWAEYMANEIMHSTLKFYPEKGHLIIFEHVKEIFNDLHEKTTYITK